MASLSSVPSASGSSSSSKSASCVSDDEETETDEDDEVEVMEEEDESKTEVTEESQTFTPSLERMFFPKLLPECDERLLGAFPDCDPTHESVTILAVVEWMMYTATMEQLMVFARRRKIPLKKLTEVSPPVLYSALSAGAPEIKRLELVPYVYQALVSAVSEEDTKLLSDWGMVPEILKQINKEKESERAAGKGLVAEWASYIKEEVKRTHDREVEILEIMKSVVDSDEELKRQSGKIDAAERRKKLITSMANKVLK